MIQGEQLLKDFQARVPDLRVGSLAAEEVGYM